MSHVQKWHPNNCKCKHYEFYDKDEDTFLGMESADAIARVEGIIGQKPQKKVMRPFLDNDGKHIPNAKGNLLFELTLEDVTFEDFKCEYHQSIADIGAWHSTLKRECEMVAEVRRHLLGHNGTDYGLSEEKLKMEDDGSIISLTDFKGSVLPLFAFKGTGENRTLDCTLIGAELTAQQKQAIETAVLNDKGSVVKFVDNQLEVNEIE